jgi:hypothetical protein
MGLFNFSNKNANPTIQDLIWMSHTAKLNGCLKLVQLQQDVVIAAWFSNTVDEFDRFLNEQNGLGVEILQARSMMAIQANNKKIILLEHYPLLKREIDFISNVNPSQVIVLSSLDEPLFEQFGSDKIIQVMKSLGMKDDEMIQHPMITKAIVQAQTKLEKKVVVENSANSSKEWFERNGVS